MPQYQNCKSSLNHLYIRTNTVRAYVRVILVNTQWCMTRGGNVVCYLRLRDSRDWLTARDTGPGLRLRCHKRH